MSDLYCNQGMSSFYIITLATEDRALFIVRLVVSVVFTSIHAGQVPKPGRIRAFTGTLGNNRPSLTHQRYSQG